MPERLPHVPSSPDTPLGLTLEPDDSARLANLAGAFNANLRQVEERLSVEIHARANHFRILGPHAAAESAAATLQALHALAAHGPVTPAQVHLALVENGATDIGTPPVDPAAENEISVRTRHGSVRGRGAMQRTYLSAIDTHDLCFGIGPAGTGKTYLAVASAVNALSTDRVHRLVLVRPAVEAGEKLGFLPGDMAQKIDPYLRPLYDALYEMLGFDKVTRLIERDVIEVAPLAFMRGRTLNDAFIILDEAQNTTVEQMKMFLTRIGFGSVAVVTGDVTQIDLPHNVTSGLADALGVLEDVDGISVTHFSDRDVVRHPLVQTIVRAYARREQARDAAVTEVPRTRAHQRT